MTAENFSSDIAYAQRADARDPLARFRERFWIPEGMTYMDGNSLGLCPRDGESSVLALLDQWKTMGINGWLDAPVPWFYLPEHLGARVAPLVGAKPEEVVLSASTTTNLHTLVATFFRPDSRRYRILADELNFPSDLYALRSQLRLAGRNPQSDLVLARSLDALTLDENELIACMDDTVALAVLPSVLYRSGQLLDMERLARIGRERGVVVGFDCSHSVGSVPHHFDAWGVDFAFWCSYKHLNGGPGSPAFLYVNERHFDREPGLAGWFGYAKERQFDLAVDFVPQRSAGGWQIGSPHLLSAAPLLGSLAIFAEAGIETVREKSLALTTYLMELVDATLTSAPYHYQVATPRDPRRRGGHVAVEHPTEAWRICQALKARRIVPDFRPDRILRIAPVALYNSFEDVWHVAHALREIVDRKEYEAFPRERGAVS